MTHHHKILAGISTLIIVIILGVVRWSLIPRYDLIVFPEMSQWPEEVVSAARQFSSSSPAERGDEAKAVESFILWSCEQKRVRPIDYIISHETILRPQEVEELLGSPSFKLRDRYYYFCEDSDGSAWSMVLGFQHHALTSVGISAGEADWNNPQY
jgi:hypothetical protein